MDIKMDIKIEEEIFDHNDEIMDIDGDYAMPMEFVEAAESAAVLQDKSKERYMKIYEQFERWRNERKVKCISEEVIMAYFYELSIKNKPTSLWAYYSMLKATMRLHSNIDIAKFHKVIEFLKSQSNGYQPSKANVFSEAEIKKFIVEAPDDKWLDVKVVCIFAVSGALGSDELTKIMVDDVQSHGNDLLLVRIPKSRNKSARLFTIGGGFYGIVKKYAALRVPGATDTRFFVNFHNGKCTRQVMGKHKLGEMPRRIAAFLELEDPQGYTGHSFRRSSAIILAKTGTSIETISREEQFQDRLNDTIQLRELNTGASNRQGSWCSWKFAEGCIEDSVHSQKPTGDIIISSITSASNGDEQERVHNRLHDPIQLGELETVGRFENASNGLQGTLEVDWLEMSAKSSVTVTEDYNDDHLLNGTISKSNTTPMEFAETAECAAVEVLQEKSKEKYMRAYDRFEQWRNEKNVKSISEEVMMTYFYELAEKNKPTSLWAYYSMLKATMQLKSNIDMANFHQLIAFLKSQSNGYQPAKAKVFSEAQIKKFIVEAPDEQWLAVKVVCIFAVSGALRSDEMINLKVDDVQSHGNDLFLVRIPKSRNKSARLFTIGGGFYGIVNKYAALRAPRTTERRFFVNYQKGRCTRQVMGKNKLSGMPCKIATFLKLEDPQGYTGHSFRRTSATILTNISTSMDTIKREEQFQDRLHDPLQFRELNTGASNRQGSWCSSKVAEGHIEESMHSKKLTGDIIISSTTSASNGYEQEQFQDRLDDPIQLVEFETVRQFESASNGLQEINSTLATEMKKNKSYLFGRDPSVDRMNRPKPTTKRNLEALLEHDDEDDAASVFLRLRPVEGATQYAIDNNVFKIWNSDQQSNLTDQNVTEKHYTFSSIFGSDMEQRQVYNSCVQSSIENDDNLTILMYGTSGSGKTYTLMGEADEPGIIPRAIEHIFARYEDRISSVPAFKACKGKYSILTDQEIDYEISQRQQYFTEDFGSIYSGAKEKMLSEHQFVKLEATNTNVYIWISFVEIYNENVHDLLELPSTSTLKKRSCLKVISNDGNTFIKDLTSVFVVSSEEASKLLTMGLNSRLNATTNINRNSSRSHCIFLIDVIKHERSRGVSHSSYKFCDLAGSERLKKSETTGCRLKEAQNINTSLLVLGRCLDTVYSNQAKKKVDMVPFRESKLTLFLQSSLLGKEKLTMVVNVSPTLDFYDENLHVLQYASMAQEIVYKKPVKKTSSRSTRFSFFLAQACSSPNSYNNSENDTHADISLLLDENHRLKEYIEQLERELIDNETSLRNALVDECDERLRRKEEAWDERMKKMTESLKKRHEQEVDHLKAKLERRETTIDELLDEIESLKQKKEEDSEDSEPEIIQCDDEDSDREERNESLPEIMHCEEQASDRQQNGEPQPQIIHCEQQASDWQQNRVSEPQLIHCEEQASDWQQIAELELKKIHCEEQASDRQQNGQSEPEIIHCEKQASAWRQNFESEPELIHCGQEASEMQENEELQSKIISFKEQTNDRQENGESEPKVSQCEQQEGYKEANGTGWNRM